MNRRWDIEELIEHFTLIEEDLPVLGIKMGATRLGCALLLKCFQYEGRFPLTRNDIPKAIIDYIACQLKLDAALFAQYDWEGRTIKGHWTHVREHLSFREVTVLDTEEMKQWLIAEKLASDQNMEHLKAVTIKQFRERKIEPPTADRMEWLIHSACTTYEQTLFAEIMQRLSPSTRTLLDDLLARSTVLAEQEEQFQDDEPARTTSQGRQAPLTWQDLKTNPGAVGLDSVLHEIDKVRMLMQLALPANLFEQVSPKVITLYRQRAATNTLYELRRHPDAPRYTLLSAFCQQRVGEMIDSLVDLLLVVMWCRGLWVVGANKYRNPDDDLPLNFEEKRTEYYEALGHPEKAEAFITTLRQEMIDALMSFDQALPKLSDHVRILDKKGGWISLTPLTAQPEPQNLRKLKAEIVKRWGITSLLDILKEAALRIGFMEHFKSPASREVLDREILHIRLLLCLYGIGTNTGLKRISQGDHGQSHNELIYTRRRFINQEHLRAAIIDVANAIFQVRQSHLWGEGTTTWVPDSTQFGAWDQNLMIEWHMWYGGKGTMIYWHLRREVA